MSLIVVLNIMVFPSEQTWDKGLKNMDHTHLSVVAQALNPSIGEAETGVFQ